MRCHDCGQELPVDYPDVPWHVAADECLQALVVARGREAALFAARQEALRRELLAEQKRAAGLQLAYDEILELNFNLAKDGPSAKYLYDLKLGFDDLWALAELVRDFFEGDPAGHARYLFAQAQLALKRAARRNKRIDWAQHYAANLRAVAQLAAEADTHDATALIEAARAVLARIEELEAAQRAEPEPAAAQAG